MLHYNIPCNQKMVQIPGEVFLFCGPMQLQQKLVFAILYFDVAPLTALQFHLDICYFILARWNYVS